MHAPHADAIGEQSADTERERRRAPFHARSNVGTRREPFPRPTHPVLGGPVPSREEPMDLPRVWTNGGSKGPSCSKSRSASWDRGVPPVDDLRSPVMTIGHMSTGHRGSPPVHRRHGQVDVAAAMHVAHRPSIAKWRGASRSRSPVSRPSVSFRNRPWSTSTRVPHPSQSRCACSPALRWCMAGPWAKWLWWARPSSDNVSRKRYTVDRLSSGALRCTSAMRSSAVACPSRSRRTVTMLRRGDVTRTPRARSEARNCSTRSSA